MSTAPEHRIGKYEIKIPISKVGRARLYAGIDPTTSRKVALKMIPTASLNADALPAFRKYAQALSRLEHPGIAAFIDLVETDGGICLVTELCEGKPLSSLLEGGAHPDMKDIWDIARRVLEALAYAHMRGAVHRDLKPSNVILGRDGTLKLTDFGVSFVLAGPPEIILYRAPEQFVADAQVTARTDIYQAGAIFYHMLTGHPPFSGTPEEIEHRVHEERPSDPSSYNNKIAWQLDWVVQKALSKDPVDRFAAATDFGEGFRLGLQDTVGRPLEPITPPQAGAPATVAKPAAKTPPPGSPVREPHKPPVAAGPAVAPAQAGAQSPAARSTVAPAQAGAQSPAVGPPVAPAQAGAQSPAVGPPVTPAQASAQSPAARPTVAPAQAGAQSPAARPTVAPAQAGAQSAASLAQKAQALKAAAAAKPVEPAAPAAAKAEASASSKTRILFVDDDERILNALKTLFRQDYDVTTALGGEAALAALRLGAFHVIVSDQRMPGVTGVELLRQARTLSPNAVRMLLTGYTDLAALVGSINQGEIFKFVMKPWENEELKNSIAEAARIGLELAASASAPGAGAVPAKPANPRSAGSILVIDPKEGLAKGLERLLAGAAEVMQVPTAQEAAKLLQGREIAAIVADLAAGSDGLVELFKQLKEKRPEILSILIAEEPDSELGIELINKAQIYRFLPKPVSAKELRTQVAAAMRRYATIKQISAAKGATAASSVAAERARATPDRAAGSA